MGMGKLLCQTYPKAAEIFQRANDSLGIDLRKICFEGPESELVLTQNNQPALLTTSIACWEVFKQQVPTLEVVACAGLSLGEYTALVVAGSLSFEDALKLVRARGTYMQEACELVPGGMASIIGLEIEQVRELCRAVAGNGSSKILDIANVNCPGQIVVSGHRDTVLEAGERVSAMEFARAITLNVSGAFHSRLMQPAADRLRKDIADFKFRKPQFPVMTNVTGRQITDCSSIPDLLVQQITSPVLWEHCVRSMMKLNPEVFLEIGSGRVLGGLLRKIDRKAKSSNIEDAQSLANAIETCKGGDHHDA